MKLEVGKYYKDAEGNKVGPVRSSSITDNWCIVPPSEYWHYWDGTSVNGNDPDIVSEWRDEPLPEGTKVRVVDQGSGRHHVGFVGYVRNPKANVCRVSETPYGDVGGRNWYAWKRLQVVDDEQDTPEQPCYAEPCSPEQPCYAALAAQHRIKITVQVGEVIVEYDGRV